MNNKTTDLPLNSLGATNVASEEFKDPNIKYGLSRLDHELYKEEDDVALPVIRVKHINLPNKGERWRVLQDNKVIQTIEGNKLTKKEREFLQSIDGANWLLSQVKVGIKSFNSLKNDLKKKLK